VPNQDWRGRIRATTGHLSDNDCTFQCLKIVGEFLSA
jgi:hypothetical protein